MKLNPQQKAFLLESYFRNGTKLENGQWQYSIEACFHEFRESYPNELVTYDAIANCIKKTVATFREHGSVEKKGSGRPTKRTEEVMEEASNILTQRPSTSLRHLSQEINLSYGTCQKVVKKDLKLYPFKVSSVQELKEPDYQRRVEYCRWFQEVFANDELLDLTFFSDEAWFHLDGYVNSQNMRVWSAENPHVVVEKSLHPQKIGVWVAVSRRRMIGPFFFNETINAERYQQLILEPFINQLDDEELRMGYFQQDSATAHTAHTTLSFLQEFFENRLISKGLWPPRSPDLTPLDFWLFGHLKNTIYRVHRNTIEELQHAITEACEAISPQCLQNVFGNMRRRVQLCIEHNGAHFEQYL